MRCSDRTETMVYLSLGANLGDRLHQLTRAVELLQETGALVDVACSSVYETEPVEFTAQPEFLNLVCRGLSCLTPWSLLEVCRQVELGLGRTETVPKGPRTIDIDVLLYGQHIVTSPDLSIPHPAMYRRRFVLMPLAELDPEVLDPVTGRNASELLAECLDPGRVVRIHPPVTPHRMGRESS